MEVITNPIAANAPTVIVGVPEEIFDESENTLTPMSAENWTTIIVSLIRSYLKAGKFRRFLKKLIVMILLILCVKFAYGFFPIPEIKEVAEMLMAICEIIEFLDS